MLTKNIIDFGNTTSQATFITCMQLGAPTSNEFGKTISGLEVRTKLNPASYEANPLSVPKRNEFVDSFTFLDESVPSFHQSA